MCQLAIVACDLAEVLGTAIALKLLFGLPLIWGVALTAFDVMLILALQNRGFRRLEAFIVALLAIIALCFAWELALAQPSIAAIAGGILPSPDIVTDPAKLYIAIGILGATVMPHNLYLHSAVVQTRDFGDDESDKRDAVKWATLDVVIALSLALFVNAAILILSAATFHTAGRTDIADIEQAHQLLAPMLGAGAASVVFAVALLASGQNSTVTGTLAGQIVAEGFLGLKLKPWVSRITTRLAAILPAAIVVGMNGDRGATAIAGAEPGHPEPAAPLRDRAAGPVHAGPQADGAVRQRPGDEMDRVGDRGGHDRAEREPAGRVRFITVAPGRPGPLSCLARALPQMQRPRPPPG